LNIFQECYGLVDRYLRKLDEELLKFKLELEADNRGITEILEKQSLEMDAPATIPLKENRLPKKIRKQPQAVSMMPQHQQIAMDFMSPSIRLERGMDYDPSFGTASMSSVASSSNSMVGGPVGAQAATPSFPLQHIGVGGNAIAAAASQAIAATQQLSGRVLNFCYDNYQLLAECYATLRYATLRYATLRYATLRVFMEKNCKKIAPKN
jgi:inhibitor of growth protein 3